MRQKEIFPAPLFVIKPFNLILRKMFETLYFNRSHTKLFSTKLGFFCFKLTRDKLNNAFYELLGDCFKNGNSRWYQVLYNLPHLS